MLTIAKKRIAPEVMVLELAGSLVLGRPCQQVERHIEELVSEGTTVVVLDLNLTGHVDSTGLGTIVNVSRKLEAGGGQLRVAGASTGIENMARRTGVSRLIPFYRTVEEAVEGRPVAQSQRAQK